MVKQREQGTYAFLMPDGNTYIGKYDPAQKNLLKGVAIFKTPTNDETYKSVVSRLQHLYSKQMGKADFKLVDTLNFNPDSAIIQWYLEVKES